jgi:hypothetical protein
MKIVIRIPIAPTVNVKSNIQINARKHVTAMKMVFGMTGQDVMAPIVTIRSR